MSDTLITLLKTEKSLRAQKPITRAQSTVLLDWCVEHVRKDLEKDIKNNENLSLLCGVSQITSAVPLERMRLDVYWVNVRDIIQEPQGHAVTIVRIPIQTDNNVQNDYYLIDVTFGQFEDLEILSHDVLKTSQGKHIHDSLLKQGYVNLDTDIFNTYISLFTGKDVQTDDFLKRVKFAHQKPKYAHDLETLRMLNFSITTPSEEVLGPENIVEKHRTRDKSHNDR